MKLRIMSAKLFNFVMFLLMFIKFASLQGLGENGNLRLCVVEGRGTFKRASKYCPVLDKEKDSKLECVLGTDRLDCLRRISKGAVDFGVFSPEDLIAAQWANVDVLVTNEIRSRDKPFERSVVAVANNRILADGASSLEVIMKNRTLCHPGVGVDDIRPISDTLTGYLESLIIPRSCEPELSLAENKIKALAAFFGKSCKAGDWVLDAKRDKELKTRYSSLCGACRAQCNRLDPYWGDQGALTCLVETGDVTWAELEDVYAYFGLKSKRHDILYPNVEQYSLLCRDGSKQPLNGSQPCVWLHRPWPVIVARRKAAVAVASLALSLSNKTVTVDSHWRGALAALLEIRQAQPEPLQPPVVPMDYLARARGFREAYSQSGCDPPRHITLCTTSIVEKNKCEWLSEAGAVYGVSPPLQCAMEPSLEKCLEGAERGEYVVQADSDFLLKGMREYSVTPILHEANPIVDQTHTVVAYVINESPIKNMADLRGKRVAFPNYDGFAWHSVLRYLTKTAGTTCSDIKSYFSEICAPGIEKMNVTGATKETFTKNCYEENGEVLSGDVQALRALIEGHADVAFLRMETFNLYAANKLTQYTWALQPRKLRPICPEENTKYCFISWSNLGHIFASNNITAMRKQEVINVFTKLDQLFGKHSPFHTAMFSMYGPFNHQMDILFHNNTWKLATDDVLRTHPYDKIPLNYERSLSNSTISCLLEDLTSLGVKVEPSIVILASLVVYLFNY